MKHRLLSASNTGFLPPLWTTTSIDLAFAGFVNVPKGVTSFVKRRCALILLWCKKSSATQLSDEPHVRTCERTTARGLSASVWDKGSGSLHSTQQAGIKSCFRHVHDSSDKLKVPRWNHFEQVGSWPLLSAAHDPHGQLRHANIEQKDYRVAQSTGPARKSEATPSAPSAVGATRAPRGAHSEVIRRTCRKRRSSDCRWHRVVKGLKAPN